VQSVARLFSLRTDHDGVRRCVAHRASLASIEPDRGSEPVSDASAAAFALAIDEAVTLAAA
jgi:hypothetical protein